MCCHTFAWVWKGEKVHQKIFVLLEYPGSYPCVVTPLREYEDGSIHFSNDMNEDEIQKEIARVLRDKTSVSHDLCVIHGNDFTFVKCANKKVRVPDEDSP